MTAPFRQGLTVLIGLCLVFGNQPAWSGVLSSAGEKELQQDVSAARTDTSPQLSVEKRIARIQAKIEETRRELAVAQAASEESLPGEITIEDLQERQNLLRWLLSWYDQQLSGLEAMRNLQRDVHLDTSAPIRIAIAPSLGVSQLRSEAGTPPGERVAKSR
jgi:hypothetical protein